MRLIDEEEVKKQREKSEKAKKVIVILIILLLLLSVLITILIFYRIYNPNKITTTINGTIVEGFDSLLDISQDENNQTQIFIPIKDVAPYLGYKSFDGEYKSGDTVDKTKCYVIKDDEKEGVHELATFSLGSKIIYKINLQKDEEEYNYCYTDQSVFESNGKLYTSIEGIERGYNVVFSYDDKKKTINIFTIDYLVNYYSSLLANKTISNYGEIEVDFDNYENWKAIFENMLVIKADGMYAVLDLTDDSFVLEPKYDNIEYNEYSQDFLILSNKKQGIISKEGKTKINAIYDELTLMNRDANLYKMKRNDLYGVIDGNENVIIHPENDKIGIDASKFSDNGIKNGYIILDTLIPVQQNEKWALYNINGKMVSNGYIYDEIGYEASNSNNVYSLLAIPDYNVIVVGADDKYTFMDINGNDQILPFVFDEIYMKISSGEISYYMTDGEKTYDVLKNLNNLLKKETDNKDEQN